MSIAFKTPLSTTTNCSSWNDNSIFTQKESDYVRLDYVQLRHQKLVHMCDRVFELLDLEPVISWQVI